MALIDFLQGNIPWQWPHCYYIGLIWKYAVRFFESRPYEKIALLGAIQSLFEGSMYTFVFLWTPALSPNDEEIPHGFIFATFRLASMLGTSIAARLLARNTVKVESYMQIVFVVSSAALLLPILTNFLITPSKAKGGGITLAGCLQVLGFCVFEDCVGIFWPSIMKMRFQYIPEEARITIINFFRIPLNIFICVVLYNLCWVCAQYSSSWPLFFRDGYRQLATLCQWDINPDIRKTEDKVADSVLVAELTKPLTPYCRFMVQTLLKVNYFTTTKLAAASSKLSKLIVVCSNRLQIQDEVTQVVIHELFHAYDECRAANLNWSDCAHHACTREFLNTKSAEAGTIPSFYKKKPEEGSTSHRVQRLAKYLFLKEQSDLLLNADDLDAMWVCLRENCVIDDATGAEKRNGDEN
ncbi:probable serine/threonine-protein phosphatase 2a regulatory subunit b'' subunit ton2 [Phtheirospermum japonicum]|uniref:Molybdate-anion transporter n=1 Tax=Phtheirospermum japonicum TaxID=374723 RepID=A0A830B9I1_9LAMI|nr:probable serine/threonine-protein phosphatase 2a regulatory subunit b'' subunit ton2 [Phtheirospermum japonicum]